MSNAAIRSSRHVTRRTFMISLIVMLLVGLVDNRPQVNAASTPSVDPTNANLVALTTGLGTLSPAFAPGVTSYSVELPITATDLDIVPTTATGGAAISVRGLPASSGQSISVPVGINADKIDVKVTAADGTTAKTYTIAVKYPAFGNECANPQSGWLFCDDFSTDQLSKYYDFFRRWGRYQRESKGIGGSQGMVSYFGFYSADLTSGVTTPPHGTWMKLAVGKTPDNAVYKPVGEVNTAERELYWRFYIRNNTNVPENTNISNGPLARVYGYGPGNVPFMQIDVNYPDSTGVLVSDLRTGTFDGNGAPTGTQLADTLTGTTPIMAADQAGPWRLVELHAKLNDPGQANGVYQLWIDGELESSKTGLNWVGTYTDYGINAVELYNTNNQPGVPGSDYEYRVIDNLVVSRTAIGAVSEDSQPSANLSNIAKDEGKLTPFFQANHTSYTLTVDSGVSSTLVTPVLADSQATIKVNGSVHTAGASVQLTVASPLTIEVTSSDGNRSKTYTVALAQAAPFYVNECSNVQSDWLFCDDFETNRLNQYFEHMNPGQFYRTTDVGLRGSSGMKAEYREADGEQYSTGALRLAFGRTPDSYMKSVAAQGEDLREVYYRFYVKHEADWIGGGGDKLTRIGAIQTEDWAEAMKATIWSGTGSGRNLLVGEPISGTDASGNLTSTHWNDFTNQRYLGPVASNTPMYDENHVGNWFAVETRVKLNDPGQSNGILQVWIDDQLQISRTDLNYIGSLAIGPNAGYGLNWLMLENYWNAGTPQDQERYFDNLVVSRSKIGLATAPDVSALTANITSGQPGQEVEFTIGVPDLDAQYSAADVIVQYDPQRIEFATETEGSSVRLADSALESLLPGFAVASAVKPEFGQLRVLMASAGVTASGPQPIFKLHGKLKSNALAGTAAVSLNTFDLSYAGVGTGIDLSEASVDIDVILANKAALQTLIASAQNTHNSAVAGTEPGQYPSQAKQTLQAAINAALAVYDDANAAQQQVDAAITTLNGALTTFAGAVNPPVYANFTALDAAIATAQSKRTQAVEGTKLGQYTVGSKAVLQQAISAAQAVRSNSTAAQSAVDQATTTLQAAIQTFAHAIITLVPGATQVSIHDLSILAQHFGMTSSDPNWSQVAAADLLGHGTISIETLAAVAQKILNDWAGIATAYPEEEEEGTLVNYRFYAGDTWIDKDGWHWDGVPTRSRTIDQSPDGTPAAQYHYSGGNNPFGDGTLGAEQYFNMPELSEFWLKRRIWIPDNYEHRKVLSLTLADATGWEIGDVVQGLNAQAHGVIRYMSGNKIGLTDATYELYNDRWNTTVTNLTKGLTTTASGRVVTSNNNKFQVFYADGYSSNGKSPTLVYQLWPNNYPDGTWGNGSNISLQIAVDGYGSGQRPNTNSDAVPFLDGDDVGMWIDVVFYVKMASSPTVYDGTAIVWLRKEGETEYTKKLDLRNLNMGVRPDSGALRKGYIWGWANSGYEEPTTFYEAQLTLANEPIDGLTP